MWGRSPVYQHVQDRMWVRSRLLAGQTSVPGSPTGCLRVDTINPPHSSSQWHNSFCMLLSTFAGLSIPDRGMKIAIAS